MKYKSLKAYIRQQLSNNFYKNNEILYLNTVYNVNINTLSIYNSVGTYVYSFMNLNCIIL